MPYMDPMGVAKRSRDVFQFGVLERAFPSRFLPGCEGRAQVGWQESIFKKNKRKLFSGVIKTPILGNQPMQMYGIFWGFALNSALFWIGNLVFRFLGSVDMWTIMVYYNLWQICLWYIFRYLSLDQDLRSLVSHWPMALIQGFCLTLNLKIEDVFHETLIR